MARRENALKRYLIKIMGTRWSIQSHEDMYTIGIPDLSYGIRNVNGWIELKQVDNWTSGLVKPKEYTAAQVNWLRRRGKKGGHCFVLVKVDDEYFIFHWSKARSIRHGMVKQDYYEQALGFWDHSIDPDELEAILHEC